MTNQEIRLSRVVRYAEKRTEPSQRHLRATPHGGPRHILRAMYWWHYLKESK